MPIGRAARLKPLAEQVIVVTGASSGIGRATAVMGAARGAAVVCAARNLEALDTLVAEIEAAGGRALAVACDVADPEAVRALAERAAAWGSGIDTWVNNAGVAIAAPLSELCERDARRLFDVDFWGTVAGCRAALPHLVRGGGALINIGSVVSDVAAPLMGIYSAAKQAIRGYTDALRIEMMMERRPVSVTLVRPAPIATPVLQQQRNRLPRQATMPPPFYTPEDVAKAILHAAEHPVRDLYVGSAARIGSVLGLAFPAIADVLAARTARAHFMTRAPRADRPDNLYEPSAAASVAGDTHGRAVHSSRYTALRLHPKLTAASSAATLAALLAAGWLRARRSEAVPRRGRAFRGM